jgi:hypothetical protein
MWFLCSTWKHGISLSLYRRSLLWPGPSCLLVRFHWTPSHIILCYFWFIYVCPWIMDLYLKWFGCLICIFSFTISSFGGLIVVSIMLSSSVFSWAKLTSHHFHSLGWFASWWERYVNPYALFGLITWLSMYHSSVHVKAIS